MNQKLKDELASVIDETTAPDDLFNKLLVFIEYNYEFKCPAIIYGGPGHQSRHTCDRNNPHSIDDTHYNDYGYEWTETAVVENGKLIFNPKNMECSNYYW